MAESMQRPPRLAVCGPGEASSAVWDLAEEVGREIARRGAILVCGGLGGVMEAAAFGARQEGGLTVGILPGAEARGANPSILLPLATGLGEARNVLVVRAAEAVIAVAGSYGTLSEVALALKIGVPVVGLGTWQLVAPDGSVPPIHAAGTAREAVEWALEAARGR